jgi:FimV-like protein
MIAIELVTRSQPMFLVRGRAKYLLLTLLLSFASLSYALGYGALKVYSYLGEPLVAEITLTSSNNLDISLLRVDLASAKDFSRAGIDRPYVLNSLNFELFSYKNQAYILIRTAKPIQTPYLEFLVELSWPDGNLVKEYTILLDPPPANLNAETRPKPISQIAMQTTKNQSQSFGTMNAAQAQLEVQAAAQQKAAAEASLSNVVRSGNNSFSDDTFDVATKQTATGTQLVPSVVPDVVDVDHESKAGQEAYELQRQNFKQQQIAQEKQAQQKSSATLLNKVVNNLEDAKSSLNNNVNLNELLEEERAELQSSAASAPQPSAVKSAPPSSENASNINFNQVIKPIGPPKPTESIESTAQVSAPLPPPAHALSPAANLPLPEPPNPGHHLFYLAIILSLFLIAAGIAVAIKRGMNLSRLVKRNKKIEDEILHEPVVEDVPVSNKAEAEILDTTIDNLTPEDVDAEHIELASPQQTPEVETPAQPLTAEEADKFEQEFENIDLDQLGAPPADEQENMAPTLVNDDDITLTEDDKSNIAPTLSADTKSTVATEMNYQPQSQQQPQQQPQSQQLTQPQSQQQVQPQQQTLKLQIDEEGLPAATTAEARSGQAAIANKSAEQTSGLHLSEEGATLTSITDHGSKTLDNSEAIALKLELAKQYLDAGEKESAKELLNEVIETANDAQKLEARILLTSIV